MSRKYRLRRRDFLMSQIFLNNMETVTQLRLDSGVIVGMDAAGREVCRFSDYSSAKMGFPMSDGSEKPLFVFVDESAFPSLSVSTSPQWVTVVDNSNMDLTDAERVKTTDRETEQSGENPSRKMKFRTYPARRIQNINGTNQYRIVCNDVTIYVPDGVYAPSVRSVTVYRNDFLYAVPMSLGRLPHDMRYGRSGQSAFSLVYAIRLHGDDKWKVGYSRDGLCAIEETLKHPDSNSFFKSLQRNGLRNAIIFISHMVREQELTEKRAELNRYLIGNGGQTYLYRRDDKDFVSDTMNYTPLVGFEYKKGEVIHRVETDNIMGSIYELYTSKNWKGESLKIKLI